MSVATDIRDSAVPAPAAAMLTSRFGPLADRSAMTRLGIAATAAFAALAGLSNDDGPVLCPLRRCSGGYCPGCGMTRSGGRLLRGDLAGSWAQHPFVLIALAQLAVIGGLWAFGSNRLRTSMKAASTRFLMANFGLMILIWIARMADGSIPIPFFN